MPSPRIGIAHVGAEPAVPSSQGLSAAISRFRRQVDGSICPTRISIAIWAIQRTSGAYRPLYASSPASLVAAELWKPKRDPNSIRAQSRQSQTTTHRGPARSPHGNYLPNVEASYGSFSRRGFWVAAVRPFLSAEPWTDHSLKGVDLGIRHLVTASEVMRWE